MSSPSSSRLVSSGPNITNNHSSNSSSSGGGNSGFLKYFRKKSSSESSSANSTSMENEGCTFTAAVSEDRNRKCRRKMEDAHTYIYNYCGLPDDGYFAVFDGHAGREAADWCSKKMHLLLESEIQNSTHETTCHALNETFQKCDDAIAQEGVKNSGTTAAVAVIKWESDEVSKKRKRMLYVANVGDTRVVLGRKGKALRLSYDHKGSDSHETKRVINQGGIVVNNRVNGMLAVTRSLGDCYMKNLVSGSPYTTETELQPQDEFIIVACDGLWDVCSDEIAVELIRDIKDPKRASQALVDYALEHFSSDNLTCMVIRLE